MPEGHATGNARSGRDEDAVLRDLLHTPTRRAEKEHVAFLCFEDVFLIELADAAFALLRTGEEHAVQPAIRDRPPIGDRDDLRTFARADDARGPVPHDARAQLSELIRRGAPREHVEHAFERAARKLREGRGLGNDTLATFDGPVI